MVEGTLAAVHRRHPAELMEIVPGHSCLREYLVIVLAVACGLAVGE